MSDPYIYEGTNILQNLLNIKDQTKLDEYENTVVNLNLLKYFKDNNQITRTSDVFEIHRLLFSDVYDWAGKPRTINTQKQELVLNGLSDIYSEHGNINEDIENLDTQYFNLDWKKMSKVSLIYNISRYIANLWQIHSFREGNTRTISTYLYMFLKGHNYKMNGTLLKRHSKYFRNALVMASTEEYSEFNHIENILEDVIFGQHDNKKQTSSKSNNYEKINDVMMDQYSYNYHEVKE